MRASLFVLCAALPAAAAVPCESLASLPLPHVSVTTAALISAGEFTPPAGRPIPGMPVFCRVSGTIRPTDDSDIRFEIWMPASGWNGKFEGVGNGGFAGSIGYTGLAGAVRRGYATAATDTGHRGTSTDASWALGHPEKIVDFGYRAIHETAVAAKAAIAAYYGGGPKRSYFSSCSNGGRQALMEAQRFPEDYDGIIAGAPANDWTRLVSNSVWVARAMSGDGFIPPAKLQVIEAAAVRACDADDGVVDGVLGRPNRCGFRPASLACKSGDGPDCLTQAQIAGLEKVLGGLRGAGGPLFPGYVVGGMTGQGGWADWITGAAPGRSLAYAFGSNFFANMVYEDRAWDFRTFEPDRDTKKADDKLASILNATDPDLGRFRDRGGKLILYHGWSDAAITPLSTIDYYKSVPRPESFARLFMVPGMQHCGGGPGPNDFGQNGATADGDPLRDVNAALERWVERGVAPEELVAHNGARTGLLCPYPKVAAPETRGSQKFVCR